MNLIFPHSRLSPSKGTPLVSAEIGRKPEVGTQEPTRLHTDVHFRSPLQCHCNSHGQVRSDATATAQTAIPPAVHWKDRLIVTCIFIIVVRALVYS